MHYLDADVVGKSANGAPAEPLLRIVYALVDATTDTRRFALDPKALIDFVMSWPPLAGQSYGGRLLEFNMVTRRTATSLRVEFDKRGGYRKAAPAPMVALEAELVARHLPNGNPVEWQELRDARRLFKAGCSWEIALGPEEDAQRWLDELPAGEREKAKHRNQEAWSRRLKTGQRLVVEAWEEQLRAALRELRES